MTAAGELKKRYKPFEAKLQTLLLLEKEKKLREKEYKLDINLLFLPLCVASCTSILPCMGAVTRGMFFYPKYSQ